MRRGQIESAPAINLSAARRGAKCEAKSSTGQCFFESELPRAKFIIRRMSNASQSLDPNAPVKTVHCRRRKSSSVSFQNTEDRFRGSGFSEDIQMMHISSYPQLFETIHSSSLKDRVIPKYETAKHSDFWKFVCWTIFLRPPIQSDSRCQRTLKSSVIICSEQGMNLIRGRKNMSFL